ncbi:MAG: oligosaccharide flippase family protein, partial [Gemmatimonadaceae bacterium]|nr:oligosaccharide flippase family protein [Gemmatimonadaceae bacterium]
MSASAPRTAAPSLLTGLAWTSALRWSAQAIAWASTLILVRVLSPTDYGTVAVAATVVGWVTIFADMGLSGSIQTTDVREPHEYGRMVGQSIIAGVTLTVLVAGLGQWLAGVFRQDALRQLLPVLSVCIVLDGARGVLSAI